MKKYIRYILMGLGTIFLSLILLSIYAFYSFSTKSPEALTGDNILTYDLKNGFTASQGLDLSLSMDAKQLSLHEVIHALHDARNNPKINGFIMRLYSSNDFGFADIQDFHEALNGFKAAGKKTAIYADSYGDFNNGIDAYYLASAFDDIWLQPIGTVNINGLRAEIPFFKNALNSIGINPQFVRREEFKNAPETFTSDRISAPYADTVDTILNSYMDDFRDALLTYRTDITTEQLSNLIANAPILDIEAKQAKLIDHIGYFDEFLDYYKKEFGDEAQQLSLSTYFDSFVKNPQSLMKDAPAIAFVNIDGAIPNYGQQASQGVVDIEATITGLEQAMLNPDIKGIIIRVNSPGGSPTGSETLRRVIEKLVLDTKNEKPIFISMGSAAASGGYWISVNADRIFALPATLTGSIGVFGGKFEISGLWEKLAVNWDVLQTNESSGLWSMQQPYSENDLIKINRLMDHIYNAFMQRVHQGRNIPLETVDKIAGGRVWTGKGAIGVKLVDQTGGLLTTLTAMKQQLGIANDTTVQLVQFPKPKSKLEQILEISNSLMGAQIWMQNQIGMMDDFFKSHAGVRAEAPIAKQFAQ
jgi:protease IV